MSGFGICRCRCAHEEGSQTKCTAAVSTVVSKRKNLNLDGSGVLVYQAGSFGIRYKDEKISVGDDDSALTSDGKGCGKGAIM